MTVFTRGLVRSVMIRVLLLPAHFRRRGRHAADSLRLRNFYLKKITKKILQKNGDPDRIVEISRSRKKREVRSGARETSEMRL